MKFNYQGRTQAGEIRSGIIEASSKEAALNILQKYGFYITYLEKIKTPWFAKKIRFFERVSIKDIYVFFRQISILFKTSVPPVEGFLALANQTRNSSFQEKIFKIVEEIKGGSTISKAFSLYPNIFPILVISMLKAGEAVGRMPTIFERLADYFEKQYIFRSKLIEAMIYPCFIVVVLIVVFCLIIFYIMPNIIGVLESTGQELPSITKIAIGLADFLKGWGGKLLFLFFLSFLIFVWQFHKKEKGKKIIDRILLRIPLLSGFIKSACQVRLAETLNALIGGGLSISQALEISADVVGNEDYKKIILEAREGVRSGESMSSVFGNYPDFIYPFFNQLLFTGEKTGQVEIVLKEIADFYDLEFNRKIDSFLKLLEPLMIISLGVIVGGFILATLMPLYNMTGTI